MSDIVMGTTQTSNTITNYIPTKISVDLAPKIDVTGNLFKLKDSNKRVQDTLIYNNFLTRLYMSKGTIPAMPELGLRDYLNEINFQERETIESKVQELEHDATRQMNRECQIETEFDNIEKTVTLIIWLKGLDTHISVEYETKNYSVRIIGVQLVE